MSTATGILHIEEPGMVALIWAGVGIAGLFVAMRGLIRMHISSKWTDIGADDCWVLLAFILLVINGVLQTLQAPDLYYMVDAAQGLEPAGKPLFAAGTAYVKYEFVIIGLFWTILWCIKASFLAMYWRLFEGLAVWKRCWWAVVIFTFLSYVGAWIASVWTCHPPALYFQFGACTKPIDRRGAIISISYSTTVDVLTDIMIIALPISLVWNLRVTKRAKAGLVGVFSLGLAIIIVAIVRAVEIAGSTYTDPVWLAVWGIVESSVSVVVGCLPPFKSLIKFERARSSATGSRSRQRKEDSRNRSDFQPLENHSEAMSYSLTENFSWAKSGTYPKPQTPVTPYNPEKFRMGTVLLADDEGSD